MTAPGERSVDRPEEYEPLWDRLKACLDRLTGDDNGALQITYFLDDLRERGFEVWPISRTRELESERDQYREQLDALRGQIEDVLLPHYDCCIAESYSKKEAYARGVKAALEAVAADLRAALLDREEPGA